MALSALSNLISQSLSSPHPWRGCAGSKGITFEQSLELKKFFEFLVGQPGIFDDSFEGIGIQSFMVRNRYTVSPVGHADVLAASDCSESNLAECSYCPLSRDISENHAMRVPLHDTQWSPLSPLQSCEGTS